MTGCLVLLSLFESKRSIDRRRRVWKRIATERLGREPTNRALADQACKRDNGLLLLLIRATVSIVGIRRPDSMKLNICRDSRVRSASWCSDNPARSRRCRMTTTTASLTGSSDVRDRVLIFDSRRSGLVAHDSSRQ